MRRLIITAAVLAASLSVAHAEVTDLDAKAEAHCFDVARVLVRKDLSIEDDIMTKKTFMAMCEESVKEVVAANPRMTDKDFDAGVMRMIRDITSTISRHKQSVSS